MPTPVTIGPVEFTADQEQAMRQGAQRARETAAARVQGNVGSTISTIAQRKDDGSKTLIERKPLSVRSITRDEF